MESPELSVYGEAKSEYTRQLSVFLVPSLETYFLELLEEARAQTSDPRRVLWQFQQILQNIPDWNQDKVIRETEKLQKDCKCDYLDELLTAVFIAHTKVLSAIRLTTRQKKLQITIPKLEHFLHRLLSESARSLWTNCFLFADTTSIEKQKNLRKVSALLQEAVLQAIRGMLPVKNILREYLKDDDSDDEDVKSSISSASPATPVPSTLVEPESAPASSTAPVPSVLVESESVLSSVVSTDSESAPALVESESVDTAEGVELDFAPAQAESEAEQPTIVIDTKPSVSFAQEHTFFDAHSLESNQIQEIPFVEAENIEDKEEDDFGEVTELEITETEMPIEGEMLDL